MTEREILFRAVTRDKEHEVIAYQKGGRQDGSRLYVLERFTKGKSVGQGKDIPENMIGNVCRQTVGLARLVHGRHYVIKLDNTPE